MTVPHILYGSPHSLYTGKTRAYLRKQGVPYVERTPADSTYRDEIAPAIGRTIIPVVVCPDGTIIQDTVDIVDHFEERGARSSARPPGSVQRVLAHVAELYAVVGLTRHAMHYRWSYREAQEAFLLDAFSGGSGPAIASTVMARMNSYLPPLGVTPQTIPEIEQSYLELLDALEAHFAEHPYLFGGQASVGDFGLLGPLYAHLGRDPVPSDIMKRRAPKVFRWVERMNASDADIPEFADYAPTFLPDDHVPPTLEPLFTQMGQELFPELTDKLAFLAAHVKQIDAKQGEPVSRKPHQRTIGLVSTEFRGVRHDSGVQPYTLYLWQRVTDAFEACDQAGKLRAREFLDRCGLGALIDPTPSLRVERRDHIEVWGRAG